MSCVICLDVNSSIDFTDCSPSIQAMNAAEYSPIGLGKEDYLIELIPLLINIMLINGFRFKAPIIVFS